MAEYPSELERRHTEGELQADQALKRPERPISISVHYKWSLGIAQLSLENQTTLSLPLGMRRGQWATKWRSGETAMGPMLMWVGGRQSVWTPELITIWPSFWPNLIENAAALTGGKRDGASLLKCCVGKLIIFVILIISVGSLETWMSDGNSFVQKLLPLANFPREISQFILQVNWKPKVCFGESK